MAETGGAGLVGSNVSGVGLHDGWGGGEFLGEDCAVDWFRRVEGGFGGIVAERMAERR